MPDFKPSQVYLGIPPLTASMGRSEREHAAALLVRACQFHGDRWQSLTPPMVGEAIKADLDAGTEPLASLNRNPFFRPDFPDLVAGGFARWLDAAAARGPIELTPEGIAALQRWVRPPPSRGERSTDGGRDA